MRVLFTGNRKFADDQAVVDMLEGLLRKAGGDPTKVTIVHGGAPGLDSVVGVLARSLKMVVRFTGRIGLRMVKVPV